MRFLVAVLAVWRIAHLLATEDGPWGVIARLRSMLGSGPLGSLMDCFKCLSVWVALPFAWFVPGSFLERAVVWLALSGTAILLEERLTEPLILEEADSNELLRTEEDGSQDR